LGVLLAGTCLCAEQGQGDGSRPQPLTFYTFAELLAKAERVVVAEVGPAQDGAAVLLVRETLKALENDPKYLEAERLKRAAELLANDKLNVSPPKPPARIRAVGEQLRLPPEGTQAIFFLWDRVAEEGKAGPAYRLAHPQCIYDIELLEQVKAGAARPRAVADGRYLRDWDREMARRARQRQANEALFKLKAGDAVMGLRLGMPRAALAMRGDNSFSVAVRVENTRARDQAVYNGPAGGYGVLLRPKKEGLASVVVRQSSANMGTDNAVLNIADEADFTTVGGNGFLAKELFFDAKDYPGLRGLDGEYAVSVFFSTEQDGKGLDLGAPVWTGAMVSEEVPLAFQARAPEKR
jgi:hypothetical protein